MSACPLNSKCQQVEITFESAWVAKTARGMADERRRDPIAKFGFSTTNFFPENFFDDCDFRVGALPREAWNNVFAGSPEELSLLRSRLWLSILLPMELLIFVASS